MAELKIPQLPPEMAHEQVVTAMGRRDAMILQTLVDKFGSEEAQKMIYARLKEMGKQMAAIAPQIGITGKDAMAIAALIHLFEKQLMRIEGEPTEVTADRVVKEVTKCPFQSLPVDFCMAYQPVVDGIIEAINPEYRWSITKLIPRGDPVCQWILEKK
jgi:predicted ArsR family transcriptional regulator